MALIIGYIHVCQMGNWHLPFDMIMTKVKECGLYDASSEIRIGVVNNHNFVINDHRFNDPKIKIVAHGPSCNYERTTLHHMRKYSKHDSSCQYWYCHTKGITHFDNNDLNKKHCVLDWINLMIHWNIVKWRIATEKLFTHDTYGCDHTNNPEPHFSGNFWWANSHYIKTLSKKIGEEYCDPEFWLLSRKFGNPVMVCNIYSSGLDGGDHYFHRINRLE